MKIKKKNLRKRLAQAPINYPPPTMEVAFNYEREKTRVENLCIRLADNEVENRDGALNALPVFLAEVTTTGARSGSAEPAIAESPENLELIFRKLCRALYFCLWHSDKPLVQHECAFKISQLFLYPKGAVNQTLFLKCLVAAFAVEWKKIDRCRLDKYLAFMRKVVYQVIFFLGKYAVRRFLAQSDLEDGEYRLMKDAEFVACYRPIVSVFATEVVDVSAARHCIGLTMHIVDVCLDELCRALPELIQHMMTLSSRGSSSSVLMGRNLPSNHNSSSSIMSQQSRAQGNVMTGASTGSVWITRFIAQVFPQLFIQFAEDVPLYAMSRGDFVEKRGLDYFLAPISGGALEQRWGQLGKSVEPSSSSVPSKTSTGSVSGVEQSVLECTFNIESQLASVCSTYAVSRSTVAIARVFFSEAQTLLVSHIRRRADPSSLRRIAMHDRRGLMIKEMYDVDQTAVDVIAQRKSLKKKSKRGAKVPKKSGGGSRVLLLKSKEKKAGRPLKMTTDPQTSGDNRADRVGKRSVEGAKKTKKLRDEQHVPSSRRSSSSRENTRTKEGVKKRRTERN